MTDLTFGRLFGYIIVIVYNNRLEGKYMHSEYEGLLNFLKYLESQDIHICIKDYVGFLTFNRNFEHDFADYLTHTNEYCMYIKSDERIYKRCCSMMSRMKNHFLDDGNTRCGVCHAGIKEYATPIFNKGEVIGAVHAGVFWAENKTVYRRIEHLCKESPIIKRDVAYRLYSENVSQLCIDERLLIRHLQVISNGVSRIFDDVLNGVAFDKQHCDTAVLKNAIIADAIAYIRQHYTENIGVESIAKFCHCSRSHLSHMFKTHTGSTIPQYINSLRIERAKELLATTNDSIRDIGAKVGFDDPNYFCRVFVRFSGITCSEYRSKVYQ